MNRLWRHLLAVAGLRASREASSLLAPTKQIIVLSIPKRDFAKQPTCQKRGFHLLCGRGEGGNLRPEETYDADGVFRYPSAHQEPQDFRNGDSLHMERKRYRPPYLSFCRKQLQAISDVVGVKCLCEMKRGRGPFWSTSPSIKAGERITPPRDWRHFQSSPGAALLHKRQ
jgi:hypothetical protein